MRVLCVGEMLVDIIVRPVEQVLLQNDTQLVREIRFSSGGDANNSHQFGATGQPSDLYGAAGPR